MSPDSAEDLLTEARTLTDARLVSRADRLRRAPGGRDGEALAYALGTAGKRVRPALVLACYRAAGGKKAGIAGIATAVEIVHTYSLVHDDLPCMDDDDLRRGRATVHIAFGEGAAVLVGDALLTEAFAVLARAPWGAQTRIDAVRLLADAAGHRGMVGGQAADIGLGGATTTLEALQELHAGKTGALISAAVQLGGLAAGCTQSERERLARYGAHVGLAFQLADDVLDAGEDEGERPSFVSLLGAEETSRRARELVDQALAELSTLPSSQKLATLAHFMVDRRV
jgi:geranylgeranyl pyrophosphate synthase